jgi:hypothetical protein
MNSPAACTVHQLNMALNVAVAVGPDVENHAREYGLHKVAGQTREAAMRHLVVITVACNPQRRAATPDMVMWGADFGVITEERGRGSRREGQGRGRPRGIHECPVHCGWERKAPVET